MDNQTQNLIIVCAGGMGREVYHLAEKCINNGLNINIKGFIDDTLPDLSKFSFKYPSILSTIKDYIPEENDVFVCSLGDVHSKRKIVESLVEKGAHFISLIDPEACVEDSAIVEEGALIFHHSVVGSDAKIGRQAFIQSYACLGHDVVTGDFFRIDPKASCAGGVHAGNNVTIHTLSFVNEKVNVGDDAVVGAMSFVIRPVKAGTTVFGIPAKPI